MEGGIYVYMCIFVLGCLEARNKGGGRLGDR